MILTVTYQCSLYSEHTCCVYISKLSLYQAHNTSLHRQFKKVINVKVEETQCNIYSSIGKTFGTN